MASSSGPALNEELTTPCGHNFCRTCLIKCWTNTQTCFCPLCKELFSKRPDLQINTTFGKLVQHFKKLDQESEVFCDICDERKQKAVKTCLMCQSSYCETHLEPHLSVPRLKKHTLINPVENLEDYICQKHERPLELFCRDDQTCVCLSCTEGEHKTHNTVPIEEESREKKMIQDRMNKSQEIKHSVELRKTRASNDCFLTSSRIVHIPNWMIIGLGVLLAALIILPKQYTMSEDSAGPCPPCHNHQCKEEEEGTGQEIKLDHDITSIKGKVSTGLKFVQKFAVDVTLDPDTANPYFILSDDGKQVSDGDIEQDVPENPKRFDNEFCVLAKQGFSSGRFYYEVQVKGKTWWQLGVARESINRKRKIDSLPRPENGFWTVMLINENEYLAFESPFVSLSLREKPEKVGVFVDYEEGLVSFYDVESRSHIYSFTGQTFTDKLYPFFNPWFNDEGNNSNPLIITPVSPLMD